MSEKKKIALGTGVVAAIASSLCCIAPLIAILGGVSGGAANVSWIEPLRPYLIGLSAVALGYAFYKTYKKPKADDCGCEVPKKRKFLSSKGFLWAITVFSILMFTFPYYSQIFYPKVESNIVEMDSNLSEGVLTIDGMTCAGCEAHVNSTLSNLNGIMQVEANYKTGTAFIKYDENTVDLMSLDSILLAETGYTITDINTEEK